MPVIDRMLAGPEQGATIAAGTPAPIQSFAAGDIVKVGVPLSSQLLADDDLAGGQYLDFCPETAEDINIMDRAEIWHAGPASDREGSERSSRLMVQRR